MEAADRNRGKLGYGQIAMLGRPAIFGRVVIGVVMVGRMRDGQEGGDKHLHRQSQGFAVFKRHGFDGCCNGTERVVLQHTMTGCRNCE